MQLQNHFTIQLALVRVESVNANLVFDKRGFEFQVNESHRQAIAALDEKHRQEISKMAEANTKPKAGAFEPLIEAFHTLFFRRRGGGCQ